MFDIANLEHLAEDKAIDAKIDKLRTEKAKVETAIADAKLKIQQGENQIKRLMNQHSTAEYRARTRRLIQRGAIAEKFVADAETLTNDEFQSALAREFRGE